MILNTDRYSVTLLTRKNGVVVHDSEGAEGLLPWGQQSSAQLVAALGKPGDRPSPSRPGAMYGAGYHAVACEDGTYIAVADGTAAPYHAPPCNPTWWAICIPGRAAQTREQWLDGPSRAYIHAVARYIVDRQRDDGMSWPLTFAPAAALAKANGSITGHPCGYTSHAQVSQAWHQTDHTDPGASFPWDVLATDIAALVEPKPSLPTDTTTPTTTPAHIEPGDDMANHGVITLPDAKAQFIGTYVGPISGPRFLHLDWINSAGMVELASNHIAAGATVFGDDPAKGWVATPGAARLVKANLHNCIVDELPRGDELTTWQSPADIILKA